VQQQRFCISSFNFVCTFKQIVHSWPHWHLAYTLVWLQPNVLSVVHVVWMACELRVVSMTICNWAEYNSFHIFTVCIWYICIIGKLLQVLMIICYSHIVNWQTCTCVCAQISWVSNNVRLITNIIETAQGWPIGVWSQIILLGNRFCMQLCFMFNLLG